MAEQKKERDPVKEICDRLFTGPAGPADSLELRSSSGDGLGLLYRESVEEVLRPYFPEPEEGETAEVVAPEASRLFRDELARRITNYISALTEGRHSDVGVSEAVRGIVEGCIKGPWDDAEKPSDPASSSRCCCDEMQRRAEPFSSLSWACPQHGRVVFDKRPAPATFWNPYGLTANPLQPNPLVGPGYVNPGNFSGQGVVPDSGGEGGLR